MKSRLQMDIIRIALPLLFAFIFKALEVVIGYNTLFAIINLVLFILFVKGIINYIEDKYDITILKFVNRKTVNGR